MLRKLFTALTMTVFILTGILFVPSSYARFISPDDWDPTIQGVGTNRYSYAGNDPVNKSDPNGHFFNFAGKLAADIAMEISIQSLDPTQDVDVFSAVKDGVLGIANPAKSLSKAAKLGALVENTKLGKMIGRQFGKCKSFDGDTLVLAKNGLLPIKSLQIGDSVWARNEATGETALKTISEVFEQEHDLTYTLTLKDIASGGIEKIQTSYNHPFYIEKKGWVISSNLRINDQFVAHDGSEVLLKGIAVEEKVLFAYNLDVEEHDTFFVGLTGIWVHNQNSPNNENNLEGEGNTGNSNNDTSKSAAEDNGGKKAHDSSKNEEHVSENKKTKAGKQVKAIQGRINKLKSEDRQKNAREISKLTQKAKTITKNAAKTDGTHSRTGKKGGKKC